jgi:ATP-dependent helicase HrpA
VVTPQPEARDGRLHRRFEPGRLAYPESLPITARRDEIVQAIRDNQVLIVAGETGSGKSTQIPKFCLEAGRGTGGLIGHTQPRRVAARTIAERVAEELGSPLGTSGGSLVGYTVRFTDTVSESAVIKVMTDGILLAEIQRDRMLRRYDTLIIDEAHERSLNIDFILGYLKQLLPQRPDLHVVITSATIDTDRFARHFAGDSAGVDAQPAPVISVTGRTYPVELRYRPPDAPDRIQLDQVQSIIEAVDELSQEGPGDVLVFLSGEREIHDTADALRRHDERLEVLPLYARLSPVEQHRIFEPRPAGSMGRRVVLATNVAETSLTVPGVRYVVDTGAARISRYSKRLKVQRLPIEPVSQASANQRAGRCGRVAPGICIRLFDEEEFAQRPEFTEPEILRTNLASVILQMTAIGLGDVARFPFVEPPEAASIRDGYLLLDELAAIEPDVGTGRRRLTKIGRRLARLPIDPRLGRMVLESERLGCVREVLVIASALSIQDVRERPVEQREKANELHNRFRVDGSDLLSIVALWDHLRAKQRELSGNQFRRMCRQEFINYLRVREWMDLYSQLRRVGGEVGVRSGQGTTTGIEQSHPDLVHKAVLAGLLSHVGMRDRDRRDFVGARQARFVIAPGSVLTRRPPDWVMAAELVETNQLYARRVAAIKPQWAERAGAHLVKRSFSEARWDDRSGRAVATETVTLYGLTLVSDRVVGYDRVDHAAARAWFITKALVEGAVPDAWRQRQRFLVGNDDYLRRVRRLADRVRRVEVVDDDMLFDFYDDRVGHDVVSVQHFDRWWKEIRRDEPARLDLTDDFVEAASHLDGFPDVWPRRPGGLELPLTYRYAPGEPLDGVTVHLPLAGLNQVSDVGFDWNVRGHRAEIVETLVRSLPKALRRQLIPLGDTVAAVVERLEQYEPQDAERIADVVAAAVTDLSGVRVEGADIDFSALPEHLRLHIVVSDEHGEVHAVGRDLAVISAQLAGSVRSSIAAATPIDERRGITDWDFGDLARLIESDDGSVGVRAYPALLDVGDSVSLRVVTTPELQHRVMHGGVRRLLILNAAPGRSVVERLLSNRDRLAISSSRIFDLDALADDCIAAAIDEVMRTRGLPWTRADFDALRTETKQIAPGLAANAMTRAVEVLRGAAEASRLLAGLHADALAPSVTDANAHLGRLVRPGFVLASGVLRLDDVERYVRAIVYRLEHLAGAHLRDRQRMAEVVPLEARYARLVDTANPATVGSELVEVAWQLEELRVATFAQPLALKRPGAPTVSAKRIVATLDRLDRSSPNPRLRQDLRPPAVHKS